MPQGGASNPFGMAMPTMPAMGQLPGVGDSSASCEQAGQTLQVRLAVSATPNPNFRRIDAVVSGPVDGQETRLLTLSTVMGRY